MRVSKLRIRVCRVLIRAMGLLRFRVGGGFPLWFTMACTG